MARLELALLVGQESKKWLANFEALVKRLENATAGATSKKAKALDDDDEDSETESESDDDTETTTDEDDDSDDDVSVHRRSAKGFDSEDDNEGESEDESENEESESDESEDEEEKPVKKQANKKITIETVNDACKAKAAKIGGKEGRLAVLKVLKKKFKTETISDLKPDQYAAVIAAMKA